MIADHFSYVVTHRELFLDLFTVVGQEGMFTCLGRPQSICVLMTGEIVVKWRRTDFVQSLF